MIIFTAERVMNDARQAGGKALDLSKCGLRDIPEEVWEFKNLERLNLSNHSDYHFDQFLENHVITSFEVGGSLGEGNDIREIPVGLLKLKKLKILLLSGNGISTLPEGVEALKNLEIIDLSNNPVQRLPKGILELKHLKMILLHRTPLYGKLKEHLHLAKGNPYYEPAINRDFLEIATQM